MQYCSMHHFTPRRFSANESVMHSYSLSLQKFNKGCNNKEFPDFENEVANNNKSSNMMKPTLVGHYDTLTL